MAASDQTYRNQYRLDVVFAVCSIVMLVGTVWMFVQDYNREFKKEQRSFRDVEVGVAERVALSQIPSEEEFQKAEQRVAEARKERQEKQAEIDKLKSELASLQPYKEKSEKNYQDVKAVLESKVSLFNIAIDHAQTDAQVEKVRQEYRPILENLNKQESEAKATRDKYVEDIKKFQRQLEKYEAPLVEAQSDWKKVNDKFETQVKLAQSKQWGFGDFVRSLPVIDFMASPIKIHQFTINDVPIDYNFKHVTRFDRCMTCHQGIDRPNYTKEMLASLVETTSEQEQRLAEAKKRLEQRHQTLAGLPEASTVPTAGDIKLTTLSKDELTPSRIKEFAAHPRLDLFVGSGSKHPAEKFGCTSCHAGQGSGTSFTNAAHTPNSSSQNEHWTKDHDWEASHMWDFPMLPHRFIESSCLKCHHQVTDLIGRDNRQEAPKVLQGYNLIKDFGCFGCHEIGGRKGGRQVGPDLRLEPNPPLESLSPLEKARAESDPDNPPGKLRKVGPSLYRLAEKTNPDWTVRWLRSPRAFRPDTKMPHFYGLSNNHKDVLPVDQKEFPDTEMHAVAHYLFQASRNYLSDVQKIHAGGKVDPAALEKDQTRLAILEQRDKLSDQEKKEVQDIKWRLKLRNEPVLVDHAPKDKDGKPYAGDALRGRQLFSERGCLACHQHQATAKPAGSAAEPAKFAPAVLSDAEFGPNLSQLSAKLGKTLGDKESARIWLIQWILDPHIHSPRSKMPVTHLDPKDAADIARWLLDQPAEDLGQGWDDIKVQSPDDKKLKDLARVYLVRLLPADDMEKMLKGEQLPAGMVAELPDEERALARNVDENTLKHYLGKKAVGRLGCYACHDIPGFETAKPIGVGLNDWGKKDPTRLAFEDIAGFLETHFDVVPSLLDKDGKPVQASGAKIPYEKFFADSLLHHQREGYLHQKIYDPRSYDYNRIRAWDDRARMPQFRFARTHRKADESDADYDARKHYEEAQAREAVMTFVLGLVAEPVPIKSTNQPEGDRLAEVLGRQVLDKFNCAGCHLVRPGVFEFNNSKAVNDLLEAAFNRAKGNPDHVFPGHYDWTGTNPVYPDKLSAYIGNARLMKDPEDDTAPPLLVVRLAHALRFLSDQGKDMRDISSSNFVQLPPSAMIFPPPPVFNSPESMQAFLHQQGPYGGTFADLLMKYLVDKEKSSPDTIYKIDPFGDSSNARAAAPPILIGQGERTQPDWLYQFLLDPQRVRQMTVLRMPKFNMSKEEAQILVNYFAAVARMGNPGVSLPYPYEQVPQRQELDSAFWKIKNAEYIARLKNTKDAAGNTMYDLRVKELQPIWQQLAKDLDAKQAEAKTRLPQFTTAANEARKAAEKAKADLDAEKDAGKRTKLEARYKELEQAAKDADDRLASWKSEAERLSEAAKNGDAKALERQWEQEQAYLVDAYRLVASKQLCLQCHQVGSLPAQGKTQGPPLNLAHKRLRPGWTGRWIASPQRFLTYPSVMPNNFPADKNDQYQQLLAGTSLDQIFASRDLVMSLPRVEALPLSRFLALPLPADKSPDKSGNKAGEKTGEKK